MSYTSSHKITKLNVDKSPSDLTENEASYLLNHEIAAVGQGTLGDSNPHAANYPAGTIVQPSGECYAIGAGEDRITNEDYSLVFNSNGSHYLQRFSDANGVEIVYHGDCLQLSADPQHSIEPFRQFLRIEEVYDKNGQGCKNRAGKEYIWTDGLNPIGCIDVEASIATNSFTTPFFDICPDPCAMIQLCVPEPCGAITAEFIPRTAADVGLTNKLLNRGFKFRFRFIYYDLRASEWSDISTLYYIDSEGCFIGDDSLPRCMRLRIPIGNPMVERIELAFSVGDKGSTSEADGFNDQWLLYATIDKYKKYNSTQEKWYERGLAEYITDSFDEADCTFGYDFCNDKECITIDFKETSRVYNPMPIQPQGILRVKENNFGFFNYKQGNCPVDKTEILKFNIDVACQPDICETEYVDVKVRLVIIDNKEGYSQFVYRMNGVYGGEDDITDKAYYGGYSLIGAIPYQANPVKNICNQEFNDARNFTAYIEGTEYFVEMKQWKAKNGFVSNEEIGIFSGLLGLDLTQVKIFAQLFYQEATFKVPKGTRGVIRIKSHLAKGNDDSTSTNIAGIMPLASFVSTGNASPQSNWASIIESNKREIAFDTCGVIGNELSIEDAFVVLSASGYDNFGTDETDEFLYAGYITDDNGKPVTGALIYEVGVLKTITDHNGYYFNYDSDSVLSMQVRVEKNCSDFVTVDNQTIPGVTNAEVDTDIKITDTDYANGFFYTLNVMALDCNDMPIKGITVAITEGKSEVTDSTTGIATFKIRNNYTRNKSVRAYVMDRNGCFNLSCLNECNPCMPQTDLISLPVCFITNPSSTATTNEKINISAINARKTYLKRGGRYPFAILLQGDCGKISAAYELPYVDIPKMQDTVTGSGCLLSFTATGFTAPEGFNCLKILRGENVNPYQIQWVVDEIEKTSDGKILLTIQSLNDYNENYFFETNTVYQWLKGDRVEFIRDQDGNIIPASLHGILNYLTISPFDETLLVNRNDPDAKYFNQLLIEDDGKIDFLKKGSVIEIQRAKECTTEPVYFQVASIPILANGKLAYETGTIDTFDTYIKKRIIDGGAFQIFEHHSPSDFWGTRLTDVGKVYFTNIYENERRYGRNISINAVGQFNYFGDLVKTLSATAQGDIIAANITDGRVILFICETDNAIAMSADDLLRVNNDGTIKALPPDAIIGDPEPKISGQYGCRYSDIGSIYFGDGFATWYDGRNYCYIKHDYQFAKAVDYGKVQTYFRKIGAKMDLVNKTAIDLDKIRFSTGYNYTTRAVQLTNKSLRHPGFNNDQKLYDSPNTTILFNPDTEDFLTLVGYTAERYSHVTLNDGFGCSFIAYMNGIPYIHPVEPEKFNEFFGVATDRVITVVINKYPEKIRIPLAIEVQDDTMWFVSNVETSDPNFKSEIPPIRMKQTGQKWNASFLKNINSRGGLFSGKDASDFWIKVTFVRDNTDQLKYGTIDNQKRVKFDLLNQILFRFQLSEESGFTEQK